MNINYIYEEKLIPNSNLNNIVLDLDKTLIDYEYIRINNMSNNGDPLDYLFNRKIYQIKRKKFLRLCNYEHENNKSYYVIYARKYLLDFLESLSKLYNLFIYTNASFHYAKYIVDAIEKKIQRNVFAGIIARKSSLHAIELKTLDYLHLKNDTIIIDDTIHAWDLKYLNQIINIRKYDHFPFINYINDDDLLFLKNEFLHEKRIYAIINKYNEYVKRAKNINIKTVETYVFNHKWF
jgi:hypothetical protein